MNTEPGAPGVSAPSTDMSKDELLANLATLHGIIEAQQRMLAIYQIAGRSTATQVQMALGMAQNFRDAIRAGLDLMKQKKKREAREGLEYMASIDVPAFDRAAFALFLD